MRKVAVVTESDPAAIAATVVELAREGRFDELETLFAPVLRAVVSAELVKSGWTAETERRGGVSALGTPSIEPAKAGLTLVSVPVLCQHGELAMAMSIDDAGMLHGLRLTPAPGRSWAPPPYARQKRFTEQEVTIGSGRLAVPGTLTLPRGRHTRPGVVLLGGGGPFDRDETSGPTKPLKDLAWGLASRGVAVARFDKVTHAHGEQVNIPGLTMTEEYVPHAVAALRLLRQQPTVDPTRIFVLGHSMGGKVAPRVAAADTSVAGLVVLAGDTQPMHHAAIRVSRYLASLYPGPAAEAAVEAATRQAALVDSPQLSPSTPPSELPFGFPASYWLDLRGYDPVATAAAAGKPMLILQGGRDYQVTVEDDLVHWRAGLAHRPDVTISVHEADNHLFFPGSGQSTPDEYEAPQHVDPDVITEIVRWLAPKPPRLLAFLRRFR